MTEDKKILRVVGCLVEHDNRVLMLFRCETETDPSLWGIPAGKVEKDESDFDAIIREVKEETGISLDPNDVDLLGELSIEYPKMTVVFPVFKTSLDAEATVALSPSEHVDYGWFTPEDVLKLPNLMKDVDVIIERFALPRTDHV